MDETQPSASPEAIGPTTKVEWETPAETLEEANERIRRLYVALEEIRDSMHGGVWSERADLALHPEKQETYDQAAFERASGG